MRSCVWWFLGLCLLLGGCGNSTSEVRQALLPLPVPPVLSSPSPAASPSAPPLPSPSALPTITPTPTPAPTPIPSPTPTPAVGTIVVRLILARSVPSSVTQLRLSLLDRAGKVVFGPVLRPLTAQIELPGVPTSASQIQIDYLAAPGVIGVFQTSVDFRGTAGPIFVDDPNFEDVVQLQSLSLQPLVARVAQGNSVPYRALARFTDGRSLDVTTGVRWSASNSSVVSIDANGLAATLQVGASNVTATLGALNATTSLTVLLATATRLDVVPARLTGLQIPSRQQLTARVTLSNGSVQNVTDRVAWHSNGRAVSVDQLGVVTADARGQALITADFGQGLVGNSTVSTSGPEVFNLTIGLSNNLGSIPQVQINRFTTVQLTAQGFFSDGILRDITRLVSWTSDTPSLAAVSPTGLVTGLFPGQTLIRAKLGLAEQATILVVVTDLNVPPGSPSPPPSINPSPTRLDLVAREPQGLVAADLNGDGRPDLAVAEFSPQAAGVYLASGPGQFAPLQEFAVAGQPYSLAAGRFGNGLDLAVPAGDTGDVTVLLNDGQARFPTNTTLPTGCDPFGSLAADFDGDGLTDLALSILGLSEVQIYKGSGGGNLSPLSSFTTELFPTVLAAGDFDQRNGLDVVVCNSLVSETVTVGLNDGTGHFQTRAVMTGPAPQSVAVADFNQDGKLDLVTANQDDTLTVLLGDGAGGFTQSAVLTTPVGAISVAVGDFDGDGKLDLVECNCCSDNAQVFLGQGNGRFVAGGLYPVGGEPRWVVTADFNGDGRADFATSNSLDETLTVWTGVR